MNVQFFVNHKDNTVLHEKITCESYISENECSKTAI